MAEADSTVLTSAKLAAMDALSNAAAVAQFVQGITLIPRGDGEIHLHKGQVTGLFYVMQDLIDRINRAAGLVDQLEKEQQHG